ncbi:putative bifunctional diguanylate cyclase/phosphodiesterase [Phycisphaera mikurensis]|uniref:Signaling protein n=1 Tax=Phycisphaera mikurensis (strain NBRC 102666 / KCTC 22515 / FYK2301M01) TaxID=1142394 RepID=I0IHM4_PHYMF|nr:GGDEF and EAL domain-containing protein [Phycisphaera mikurensis]MBB6441007.1 EAL domain-containing protein (putative c-di-GMP-specific phosphodiesterase class I) [Phycisphaera mikurensis]BAM04762.1 hypothetical protein PSMK_26030 [Phycisphaera mikurensis NBRC 102666]
MLAPYPEMEAPRLADLHAHRLLDTAPESAYDGLTRLAADLFGVPIAAVSLVDADRQWFKSCVGLGFSQTPREVAICHHTVVRRSPLVVDDLAADPRFCDHPLVVGEPHLRFYAGVPLFSAGGHALGAFCLCDQKPRQLASAERDRLVSLAEQASRLIELHRDVVRAEEAALRDPVTGLLNGRGLTRLGDAALASGEAVLILSLRLSRFEAIAGGTGSGDAVLLETARRLRASIEGDLPGVAAGTRREVARVESGTFALMLSGEVDTGVAAAGLAGRVGHALDRAYELDDQRLPLTASIGLAVRERGGGRPLGLPRIQACADLLARAILAMTAAAEASSEDPAARPKVFDPPMLQRARRDVRVESDLREALDRGEIHPVLQPIVDLSTSRVCGFETLARWTHPVHGPIPPTHFIPLAERSGLIDETFAAVAGAALEGVSCMRRECGAAVDGDAGLFVSLNLSKRQLRDAGLPARVGAAVAEAGLHPHQVHLELTESDVADCREARVTMQRLRDAGFQLMLDDFGTGTSTLSGLHAYPVQWLKIDRSFTAEAARDRRVAVVADAIAELARKLGLRTVAEGLETPEEVSMFQAMGYDGGQGYLFAKPMRVAEASAWLKEQVGQAERPGLRVAA